MFRPLPVDPSQWPAASERPLLAWLMSLILHVMLLTTFGLYTAMPPRDSIAEGEQERPIGVALVHRLPDRQQSQAHPPIVDALPQPSAASEIAAQSAPRESSAAVPPDFAPPLDLAGVLAEMTAAVEPVGSLGAAADFAGAGLLDESGDAHAGQGDRGIKAATAGSQGVASLFGISGTGSRFVYIIDRSDSMNSFAGRPWRAAKAELHRSLETLTESQSFQIVFYNDQPRPFRSGSVAGPVQMLRGEPATITAAQRYVRSAEAFGGTNHIDALRVALRMSPDVIFFLTDGHIPSLSQQELADVARLAERSGTVIHAIEFGTQPAPHPRTFVRRLAADNRGEYRYFDASGFSDAH